MKTNDYLKTVALNVASQGPISSGDFLTVLAARVKAEIAKTVPARYRLAVRMAIRSKLGAIQTALCGI